MLLNKMKEMLYTKNMKNASSFGNILAIAWLGEAGEALDAMHLRRLQLETWLQVSAIHSYICPLTRSSFSIPTTHGVVRLKVFNLYSSMMHNPFRIVWRRRCTSKVVRALLR